MGRDQSEERVRGQGGGRAVKIDQQNKGRRARDGLSYNALVEEDEQTERKCGFGSEASCATAAR